MFYYRITEKIYEGMPYMAEDTSIIFKYSAETDLSLDYTVSLGGSSRYLIDVSHVTGKCGPLRCFMAGIEFIQKELHIPKSRRGELYFNGEEMSPYSGTMYRSFDDTCYYDENNGILCIGNPSQEGDTIEFVGNTYAVISQNHLTAIFLKVDCPKEILGVRRKGFLKKCCCFQYSRGKQNVE